MKQISTTIVAFAMFGLLFSIVPQAHSQTGTGGEKFHLGWMDNTTLYLHEKSVSFYVSLRGDYDADLTDYTSHVWSDSDSQGNTTYLAKNDVQNRLDGMIQFSTDLNSLDDELKVKSGDEIFVKYGNSIISIIIHEYVSPLKQQKLGVITEQVICKSDYANMGRPDGSAACIKFESTSHFVEIGWILMPGQIFKG